MINEKEKLILEIIKEIELVKEEIKNKQEMLNNLLKQLDELNNKNTN